MTVDYHKFWLQSIHSYSDTKTPVILIGTHDDKLSKAVSLINDERNWHFVVKSLSHDLSCVFGDRACATDFTS